MYNNNIILIIKININRLLVMPKVMVMPVPVAMKLLGL
jgi:hypothetical protein